MQSMFKIGETKYVLRFGHLRNKQELAWH